MKQTERMTKRVLPLVVGLMLAMMAVGGIASARTGVELPPARDGLLELSRGDNSILPLTYAYVITNDVPVYASPSLAAVGEPVRTLGAGYLWVSLVSAKPIVQDGQAWYQINANEYVRADQLALYKPSAFAGVQLDAPPESPFAWMVYSVQASAQPGEKPAKDAPLLRRYTRVAIYEEQTVDDVTWYRVGENQWIDQRKVGVVKVMPRPAGVGESEKWIDVNLFEQTLAAYEGDRMVYATLVSTGLLHWKTEEGLTRMWAKIRMAKMSGRDGYADYYYLEDVPWAMYFNRAFALHAAYWHDRFGFPHSHGCVNLAPQDAQWLFEWTTPTVGKSNWTSASEVNPGTWVWVHEK
jgi:hypothetical protein